MTIDQFLVLLFQILGTLYLGLLIAVFIALRRLRKDADSNVRPSISIVIAARNEASRISPCLDSLVKVDYPSDRYEVIIVDDNSADDTGKIVQTYCRRYKNWKLIRLAAKSNVLKGKKNALKTGIEQAQGEIIFTTDADCIVKRNWLKIMSHFFTSGVSMVIGYSPLVAYKGFFQRLLQFDNLFSAITAAVFVKFHYPFNSTGRNLAYRRSDYIKSGGFEALKRYRSGDDMHLTQQFRRFAKGKIEYCVHPETYVFTEPPQAFSELFNQQIRKNSKTLETSLPLIALGLTITIYHILIFILPFMVIESVVLWTALVLLKLLAEFGVLLFATSIFQQKRLISFLVAFQIIYPIYIIGFSILGLFKQYKWKN